ncbi:MAG: hypothetical protein MR687_05770 [Spirochaetales bacterium]|nr:hypothetical protein [Spirochaetales bacterium]
MDSKPNRDATINVRRKTESSSFRLHKDNTRNIKEEINRIPKECLFISDIENPNITKGITFSIHIYNAFLPHF